MKNGLIAVMLAVIILPARAQKIVEKHMNLSAGGLVTMDFQISDSIRIITWKKNEVYVRSSIDVNDNQNNDDYRMDFVESDNSVHIRAKLEMKGNGCGGSWNRNRDGNGDRDGDRDKDRDKDKDSTGRRKGNCCCCCGCNTEIYHEVYLPEGTDFSVETINGNIIITGNTAAISASSISGFIDLAIDPARAAQVRLRTITGTMYSNLNISPAASKHVRQVGGGSVSAELNGGGGKPIELKTISGDIFFRKQS